MDSNLLQPFSRFDFAARRAVVAGISGGSDSTALLVLLKTWLDANAPAVRLVAVTVDHGLRPDSAAEAVAVARFAKRLGVAHRTLAWRGPKPEAGLPAAAREARYALLAAAAAQEGTDLIVTGHTADDQAETIAMRQARADGRGLAGMAQATLFDGRAWIVRPLLETRREALRDHLRDRGIEWLDDPTNLNPAFERPRARAWLSHDGHADFCKLLDASREAAGLRQYLGREAAGLIRAHARRVAPGLFRLDPAFAAAEPREGAVYALRILLAAIGGTPHLPDEKRSARLFVGLSAKSFCATLSRTLVDARRAGIFMLREARGLPGPAPVREGMIWDGRYRVSGEAEGLVVGPWANAGEAEAAATAEDVPASLVRAAQTTQPMFRDEKGQTLAVFAFSREETSSRHATPHHDPAKAIPLVAPWARFLPAFDLDPAGAAGELVGASPPPAPPYAKHNVTGA